MVMASSQVLALLLCWCLRITIRYPKHKLWQRGLDEAYVMGTNLTGAARTDKAQSYQHFTVSKRLSFKRNSRISALHDTNKLHLHFLVTCLQWLIKLRLMIWSRRIVLIYRIFTMDLCPFDTQWFRTFPVMLYGSESLILKQTDVGHI